MGRSEDPEVKAQNTRFGEWKPDLQFPLVVKGKHHGRK